jgi:hypothetical protein
MTLICTTNKYNLISMEVNWRRESLLCVCGGGQGEQDLNTVQELGLFYHGHPDGLQ